MPKPTDLVIGVVGLVAIVLAAIGLVVTEGRSGPYELDIDPAQVPRQMAGTYRATAPQGTMGPAGFCIPDAPGGTCAPARLDLEVRIQGLPVVRGAAYHAFLIGPGDVRPLPLGPMEPRGDTHHVERHADTDGRAYEHLVVTLETDAKPQGPGPLVVFSTDVTRAQDGIDLAAERATPLVTGGGIVHIAQIGAVEVSATAAATIDHVTVPEGWTLHAWFRLHEGTDVRLESFEVQDGTATLGARVERVDVAKIDRFLVTLEAGATPGDAPHGFPAFAAAVP